MEGVSKLINTKDTVEDCVDNIKDIVDSVDSISTCDSAPCLALAGAGRDSRD